MTKIDPCLRSTEFLDHEAPNVRAFVARALDQSPDDPRARAVTLYYAVRDGLNYEIYGADMSRRGLRASAAIGSGSGLCIHKSIAYAAAVRAIGIHSRLVLTDVRNHLSSPRLRAFIGGDVFRYHCLTAIRLGDAWLNVTPVFNRRLCQLYGMTPLEFNGHGDSLHHPFDETGQRHMEFVHQHGAFDDFPYELVIEGLRAAHPRLFADPDRLTGGTLAAEVSRGGAATADTASSPAPFGRYA